MIEAPISNDELLRRAAQGEMLPIPSELLKDEKGRVFVFGYMLGLKGPGEEFMDGIRTYINTTPDTAALWTLLSKIASDSPPTYSFLKDPEFEEILSRLRSQPEKFLASSFAGVLSSIVARLLDHDMASSLAMGIVFGVASHVSISVLDAKHLQSLPRNRALELLRYIDEKKTRNLVRRS